MVSLFRRKNYILFLLWLVYGYTSAQHFAILGDYGANTTAELDVANLIKSWNPEFIITVGDNNYGDSSAIDRNIGKYYHEFIYPYKGIYGVGSSVNKIFPALGNHDLYSDNEEGYFKYFTLPGNERYYDFVWGNIHFFALNSDPSEVDGTTSSSIQGQWLQNKLAASSSPWKIVYFHHPPYSSGTVHGNSEWMQWPFKEWGATAVISGHEHNYERSIVDGIPYIVNGLGGRGIYKFGNATINPESQIRYDEDFGALKVTANEDAIDFSFITRKGETIDGIPSIQKESEFKVYPNTPNPFYANTNIHFYIPSAGHVRLKVVNLLGEESVVLSSFYPAGMHTVNWMPLNVKNGIYYCSLVFENKTRSIKMVIGK